MDKQEFDLEKLAKYPFLREAKQYVSSLKLNLADILAHPLYSASVEQGRQRVTDAMNGKIAAVPEDNLSRELSILSYALARMLVNHIGSKQLLLRYANSEAENAYSLLRKEKEETVKEVEEDLGFRTHDGRMDYNDFLHLSSSPAKQDPKWKLASRLMDAGYVAVDDAEKLLLLREAVKLRVMEPIDTRGIPNPLKKISAEIAATYIKKPVEVKLASVREDDIAPCIKSMLGSLEAGIISHNERFILATYFIGLGLDEGGLIKIFSRFPNFNEEKTRYQLRFLTGEKGATKYSCPSCAKIKSYGLCKAECGIRHPLSYRR